MKKITLFCLIALALTSCGPSTPDTKNWRSGVGQIKQNIVEIPVIYDLYYGYIYSPDMDIGSIPNDTIVSFGGWVDDELTSDFLATRLKMEHFEVMPSKEESTEKL